MSQSFGNIHIPNVRTSLSGKMSDKQERYRGIFTNLLVQQMLTSVVTDMRGVSQCPKTELNNMLIDTIGMAAARS